MGAVRRRRRGHAVGKCKTCLDRITRPQDGSINELFCSQVCRATDDARVIEIAHRR